MTLAVDQSAVASTLLKAWGLEAVALDRLNVGFPGSFHYRADCREGSWYVTVHDLAGSGRIGADGSDVAFDVLERAFAVAVALCEEKRLEFVLAPAVTRGGVPTVRLSRDAAVTVFPYIEGTSSSDGAHRSALERREVLSMLGPVFAVLGPRGNAYLKVGSGLDQERARLEWLQGRLPVPELLSHGACESVDWLLLTPLPGMELANLKHTESPDRTVELLAAALHVVHAAPARDCPFGDPAAGAALIHGDACMPNFFFDGARLSGVVDVGDAGLGDPISDLATAIGSIQYNLGQGHARTFLDAYGLRLDDEGYVLALDGQGNESLRRAGEVHTA